MPKLYIFVIGNRQNRTLKPIAGAINGMFKRHGVEKIHSEHEDYARQWNSAQELQSVVLSEHYLSRPLNYGPDAIKDAVITGEGDMVMQPPLTLVNYQQTTGIAAVGHINCGKSWALQCIQDLLQELGQKVNIVQDRLPGTFGWSGGPFPKDLLKQLEVEIRVLECPNRSRFSEFLQISN